MDHPILTNRMTDLLCLVVAPLVSSNIYSDCLVYSSQLELLSSPWQQGGLHEAELSPNEQEHFSNILIDEVGRVVNVDEWTCEKKEDGRRHSRSELS